MVFADEGYYLVQLPPTCSSWVKKLRCKAGMSPAGGTGPGGLGTEATARGGDGDVPPGSHVQGLPAAWGVWTADGPSEAFLTEARFWRRSKWFRLCSN